MISLFKKKTDQKKLLVTDATIDATIDGTSKKIIKKINKLFKQNATPCKFNHKTIIFQQCCSTDLADKFNFNKINIFTFKDFTNNYISKAQLSAIIDNLHKLNYTVELCMGASITRFDDVKNIIVIDLGDKKIQEINCPFSAVIPKHMMRHAFVVINVYLRINI